MPIRIPDRLPARQVLVKEGVMVMDESVAIRQDIRPWLHHLCAEVPEEIVKLEPADLHLPRLRYNYPEPYSPDEFQRTHDFMVSWGLINPASTYDRLVEARVAV